MRGGDPPWSCRVCGARNPRQRPHCSLPRPTRLFWKRLSSGAACSRLRYMHTAQARALLASFLGPPGWACDSGCTHTLFPAAFLLPRGEIHPSLSTHDSCPPPGGLPETGQNILGGPKSLFGFTIPSHGNIQMNFLANPALAQSAHVRSLLP